MGIYYSVFGLMKSKQKELDWYLKHERFYNPKYINFQFEYHTGELFNKLISFASAASNNVKPDLGEGEYILNEQDVNNFIKSVNENMFDDKVEYYQLMAELYDFHVGKQYEKYLIINFYD